MEEDKIKFKEKDDGGKTSISLEEEVIEKISIEKIKPEAKWKFVLKNWVFLVFCVISILLGALAFSSILYFFQPSELEVWRHAGANWKEFLLFSLPYFWFIFLIFFLFVAWYYFKNTNKGYRYSLPVVFAVSILSSVLLGSVLYGSGLAGFMDDFLGRQPFYGELINPRAKFWLNPNHGRLGGLVIKKNSNQDFILYNKGLGAWQIKSVDELGAMVKEGFPIVIIGHKVPGNNVFFAEDIFFPPLGGEFFRNNGMIQGRMKINDYNLIFFKP